MDNQDLKSAAMVAEVAHERWREKFEAEFFAKDGEMLLRGTFESLTPQQLEEIRNRNPAAFDAVFSKLYGGE